MGFELEAADRFLFLDFQLPGSGFLDRLPLLFHATDSAPGEPAEAEGIRALVARGETELAIETALRAAQRAHRKHEPGAAAAMFAVALSVLARSDPRRAVLRRRQGEALLRAGLAGRAARAFGAAARSSGPGEQAVENGILQSLCLSAVGRFDLAHRAAENAADNAARGTLRGRAERALALALARGGSLRSAADVLEDSLAALERGRARQVDAAETRQQLGLVLLREGSPEARRHLEDAAGALTGETERGAELPARCGLMLLRASREVSAAIDDDARELREECRRAGRLRLLEAVLSSLASLAPRAGRVDLARSLAEEALVVAERIGEADLALAARCRLAETLRVGGRAEEASRLLRTGLKRYPHDGRDAMADIARALLAGSLIETAPDETEAARDLLVRAGSGLKGARRPWASLVPVVVDLERLSRAGGEPQDPVWLEYAAQEAATADVLDLRSRAYLARASHHLERGDTRAAVREAESAERLAQRAGHSLLRCEALAVLRTALRHDGAGREAGRTEERASQLVDTIVEGIHRDEDREAFLCRRPFADLRGGGMPDRGDPRLLALYRMIHALNSERDPDALLESILDMALRAVRAERGLILLLEPPTGEFVVRLARNLDEEAEPDFESFSHNVVRRATGGTSLLVLDAADDQRFRDFRSVTQYGIRSLMCVPLRSGGKIVGAVYLDSRTEAGLFTSDDLRFLEAFAGHATIALENLRRRTELERENRRLEAAAQSRMRFAGMVGRSRAMQQVFDLIEKFAGSDLPVLIRGESGTGKELVARAIHSHGPRRRRSFLSENCAAIPDALLESELFGHVKGAFTGAERDRAGVFEQADGGTLFLDEVGDMSAAMQAKLLRVLEDRQIRRVGSNKPIAVNVRVLAATHRDLDAELLEGRFREDLYYRLQVLVAHLPPLHERPEDILPLTEHFLHRIARERGSPVPTLSPAVRELFERYPWPGNVRQLENTLQRLCLLAGDGPITVGTLQADRELGNALLPARERRDSQLSLAASERQRIREALSAAGGNRQRAAELLGISRATIYRKIRQHGLG